MQDDACPADDGKVARRKEKYRRRAHRLKEEKEKRKGIPLKKRMRKKQRRLRRESEYDVERRFSKVYGRIMRWDDGKAIGEKERETDGKILVNVFNDMVYKIKMLEGETREEMCRRVEAEERLGRKRKKLLKLKRRERKVKSEAASHAAEAVRIK